MTRGEWATRGGLVAAMVALIAAGGLAIGRGGRAPAPSLARAVEALEAKLYDRAASEARRYLAIDPTSLPGRLTLAQALLDRPEPDATAALTALADVTATDPAARAVVAVLRGKAHQAAHRLASAESQWLAALADDPRAAEAPWLLIQAYDLQGRNDEAREVALRSVPVEPDPVDRSRFLLELAREEVQKLAAAGVIPRLEAAVAADPDDHRSALALGVALAKEGAIGAARGRLEGLVARRPDDVDCWDAYLFALGEGGDVDALAGAIGRVPPMLAESPRVAAHRGWVAQSRGSFPEAIDRYRSALVERPADPKLNYRLARALRFAGRDVEADLQEVRVKSLESARAELKAVYESARGGGTVGTATLRRMADLREQLGQPREAVAWHRLILERDPDDSLARAAVDRLSRP